MSEALKAYPLAWPAGWKRTDPADRTRAQFKRSGYYTGSGPEQRYTPSRGLSMAEATSRTLGELRRMGVADGDAIISTNVELRLDGTPRSDRRAPTDTGAAVYWVDRAVPGEPRRCMAVDHYDRVEDNLAAIAATIEAMRAIERHGGAQILNRAFQGFTALPAPGQTSGGWRAHLGFEQDAKPALADVEQTYRRLRGQHHPDRPGGDAAKFHQVQLAWDQAQQEINAK